MIILNNIWSHCIAIFNTNQADADADLVGNVCDNCLAEANTDQADVDEDGYGDPESEIESCSAPVGYVDNNTDCNDVDTLVHPNSVEFCDTIDNNCNGMIDEDSSVDAQTWYADNDNDNFGSLTNTTQSCTMPAGYIANSEDCDDENPTSTIVLEDADCDGVPTFSDCDDNSELVGSNILDADCDGTVTDEDCDDTDAILTPEDYDQDGASSCDGDCNDFNTFLNK